MSTTPHILICDDDPVVHESLGLYLDAEHFPHSSAYDGEEALEKALQEKPDLIILDLMMPKMSGTDVCREIRKTSNVPIIMLTAKGEEIDRVLGLELGADDYIVKPFSPREVIARIKALFRRIQDSESGQKPSILRFDGLEINLDNYQVKVDNKIVAFTPKEVEILYLLASHAGQVMDREQILSKVWGYDYFGDTRTVDTHIKRIRQKIDSDHPKYGLITVYGVGYKFETLS
ncbi:MAG: response regulator transcription factor [Eubacteriales bacterium]|jgi:DNA-binding response OmpR family regulator|nr:response regulator transcription factor [Eubacteriales bacterium]MDY0119625.1 response regulator transcription factor [Clostridia bacterium]